MIEIAWPFPPSLNTIWRHGRNKRTGKPVVYLNAKYTTWRKDAEILYLTQKRNVRPVVGRFAAEIVLDQRRWKQNKDCDNRIKAPLDLLQKLGVIENDSLCTKVSAAWGEAPTGCIVRLYPMVEGA